MAGSANKNSKFRTSLNIVEKWENWYCCTTQGSVQSKKKDILENLLDLFLGVVKNTDMAFTTWNLS
jgi:hypothetical protein